MIEEINNIYDNNTKIWRYIDFMKYTSLIQKKSLFFSRVDKFEDKYEGFWTHPKQEELIKTYGEEIANKGLLENLTQARKHFLVNCWHINEDESASMWKSYTNIGNGIAIQTTIGALKEVLSEINNEKIIMGRINYINYKKDIIPMDKGVYSLMFYKRKSFSSEQEFRVIIDRLPWNKRDKNGIMKREDIHNEPSFEFGEDITVNIEKLIKNIYVYPSMPKWNLDIISSLNYKYEINKPINQSDLLNNFI